MTTKEFAKAFVKEFKAIMYEPTERFNDVEFKKNHIIPTGIENNDDFSRNYFFDSEVFGFNGDMIEEYEEDWIETVDEIRSALMELDDVCYVDEYFAEDGVGIEIKVM